MGRYLKEAERHAGQIDYYYDYAGPVGYQQAEYDFHKLSGLVGRALASKNDKADAVPIQAIYKRASVKMREMVRRRDEWRQEHPPGS